MNIINKLKRALKQGGILRVLLLITENEYLPKWFFHFSVSKIFELEKLNTSMFKKELTDYSLRLANKEDIENIIRLSDEDILDAHADPDRQKVDRLNRFFDEGNSCFLISKIDELVAFLMVYKGQYIFTHNEYKSMNFIMDLDDNIRMLGYGYIAKKYRLRGLFPYLMRFAIENDPDKKHITEIDSLNTGSIKAHERLGYKCKYKLVTIRLFLPVFTLWLFQGDSFSRIFWIKKSARIRWLNSRLSVE